MRTYLTKLLWHEDRLSSLSSAYLGLLSSLCFGVVASLVWACLRFYEDSALLLAENDFTTAIILVELHLAVSAALWVFSCCLGASIRRVVLYFRGL